MSSGQFVLLVTLCPDSWHHFVARTAVKVERSGSILNLDSGRSQPYRFCPAKSNKDLALVAIYISSPIAVSSKSIVR